MLDPNDLKRNQRNRLFYIDFLSYFTGSVGRADLVKRFAISEPAATNDLGSYLDLNPNMLRYDPRKKTYIYDIGDPLFSHDADDSLHAMSGVSRGLSLSHEHEPRLPSFVNDSIKRKIPTELVAAFGRSVCRNRQVEAKYLSQSKGEQVRNLSPMALVNDGNRWHMRCFDHESNLFKDYNLARFISLDDKGRSDIQIADDIDWQTKVKVEIAPHPNSQHPETIRFDFGIEESVKEVELRRCVVGYFLRHWHIDFSPDASANPRSHQLHLNNRHTLIEQGVPEWALAW